MLKAMNKKLENIRLRERDYSSRLEMEIDKFNKNARRGGYNKQV